jgi:hypothetical protein
MHIETRRLADGGWICGWTQDRIYLADLGIKYLLRRITLCAAPVIILLMEF